jgi:hypothetical protein
VRLCLSANTVTAESMSSRMRVSDGSNGGQVIKRG